MEDHEKSRDQFESEQDYRLHCLRHSTSHVLAQAVMRLYPSAKLAIGPAIADGFYYDIDLAEPLREQELAAISAEMKKIVKENQQFIRHSWSKDQARAYFGARDQIYKLELIDGIKDDEVSVYENPAKSKGKPKDDGDGDGDGADADPFANSFANSFIDLCAGPHVARTGQCKHFKLTKVSGAYWRADQSKAQLQRVYGTVWPTREALDGYLFRIEEAKKRDHRKLGRELDLIMFHEWAPGSAFWLPSGEIVYTTLADRMRARLLAGGYHAVRTPLLFDKALWETSGHWSHYKDNMFVFEGAEEGAEPRTFGLKSMNCPGHMLVFRAATRSYRDLPLRLHDQSVLHRNEMSGTLSGLTRVRQFCQDDAHIFCTEEQIAGEVSALLDLVELVYGAFDMTVHHKLSTRPEERIGEDHLWDLAEDGLRAALEHSGIEYTLNAGDGAFYGPKIDFDVMDALGRAHQCATIQLDFNLPRRFELSYAAADGQLATPVVIHRAIYGSLERFIGILIEHYAGKFPLWLAPEQVRVMIVSEKSLDHGQHVERTLRALGCRVTLDDSDHKIGYKIRRWHQMKVPYAAVVGAAEAEAGTVSIRSRDDGDRGAMPLEEFAALVAGEMKPRL